MKSILRYPGSKWRIAQWIISHFPKHHSYLEPYFGSGAVFFNKEQSNIETINDLDGNVVNLFKVIREDAAALADLVSKTPYSRQEYDEAFHLQEEITPESTNLISDSGANFFTSRKKDYEKARNFLIRCWQGHGYRVNQYKVGWKNDVQGREKAYAVRHWNDLPERIHIAAERLKQAQIECMPALELIKRFNFPNVLIYADPPYLECTRTAHTKKQYSNEMLTEQSHVEMLEMLLQHSGFVVLSGYENELYNSMLTGWKKEAMQSNDQSNKPRKEVIWMNFE